LTFVGLPPEVQRVVVRREHDRERALRRGQNEIAELKKRLMADASSTKSADNTTTEKENSNA
jgi:hypothetical protein